MNVHFVNKNTKKNNESQGKISWSFLTFLEKAVVHDKNPGTYKFGKRALTELRFCGVAVLGCCSAAVMQCCSRKGGKG